jgi:tRNA (cmo5U34)-methyltransferase
MENFDFNKIKDFDSHINTSIPNYNEMVDMAVSLIHHLVPDGGKIEDLGCSTGMLLSKIESKIPNVDMLGVDLADNLFISQTPRVSFLKKDLTKHTPKADVVILMFTLMFLPLRERVKLLERIKKENPDAVLIVTEKNYMETGKTQEMFLFSYYDYKSKKYSGEELLEKQRSIRTIMKPLTEKENVKMFQDAGYTKIIKFWQSFQFMGWVIQ